MSAEHDDLIRVSRNWLALREPADAEARALDLAEALELASPASGPKVIHDLGCGTGSMGRWLAPLLAGPQHWVLHDRDAELLELAAADAPGPAADGAPVTVEALCTDLDRLQVRDLSGATLITASALLDMLTAEELDRLVGLCLGVGCPILLTLSVIGSVEITPADPQDRRVAAAFNGHQRRMTNRGRLLGPGAVDFAAQAFRRLGAEVLVRPSAWRLGPAHSALAAEWFTGWVGAACQQEPELATECDPYARRRLAQASAGNLAVTVGHADLLVLP
jgi:SAM-dependent methyltransferase